MGADSCCGSDSDPELRLECELQQLLVPLPGLHQIQDQWLPLHVKWGGGCLVLDLSIYDNYNG